MFSRQNEQCTFGKTEHILKNMVNAILLKDQDENIFQFCRDTDASIDKTVGMTNPSMLHY